MEAQKGDAILSLLLLWDLIYTQQIIHTTYTPMTYYHQVTISWRLPCFHLPTLLLFYSSIILSFHPHVTWLHACTHAISLIILCTFCADRWSRPFFYLHWLNVTKQREPQKTALLCSWNILVTNIGLLIQVNTVAYIQFQ